MQSNCQGGLGNVSDREMKKFFKHEKSSCTKKIPTGRKRKEGFETKKLFFSEPSKEINQGQFWIDMKWKWSLLTMCLESTGSAGFPLAAISVVASGVRIKTCLCTNNFTDSLLGVFILSFIRGWDLPKASQKIAKGYCKWWISVGRVQKIQSHVNRALQRDILFDCSLQKSEAWNPGRL